MTKEMALALALAAVGGCASAARIERSAARHDERADSLVLANDWAAAAKERAAAAKEYSKANTRRAFQDVMPVVLE